MNAVVIANNTNEITNEAQTSVVPTQISPTLVATPATNEVQKYIDSVDVSNPSSVETFGDNYSNMLGKLSASLNTPETQLKNLDVIGNNIAQLMSTANSLNPNDLVKQDSFLDKLLGKGKNKINNFVDKQKSVKEAVQVISNNLLSDRSVLISENTSLEKVYNDNMEVLNNMTVLIDLGNQKAEMMRTELDNYKNTLGTELTDVDAIEIQSRNHFIERFEQKLGRLNNAKALVLRQLPQIRLMQTSNATEIDTIKDVVDTAIPLWESQIGLFVSQLKTKKGVENRKSVTDSINKTIQMNAQLMNQNTLDIVAASSSDIITIETIQTVQTNLISSVQAMQSSNEKAKQSRKDNFLKIAQLDSDLKQLTIK